MPRIPTYQPGQVGAVQPATARFRTPDSRGGIGGAIAAGAQQLGQAMGSFAEMQDHINAQNDDTQARKMAVDFAAKANAIKTDFGALMGGNARSGQQAALDGLTQYRDDLVKQAANPRMAALLQERIAPMFADGQQAIFGHALKQSQVERAGVLKNELDLAQSEAAPLFSSPDKLALAVGKVRAAAQSYADFTGAGEGARLVVNEATGSVYSTAVSNALGSGDVEMAKTIFDAHHDEMTFDQRNRTFSVLQKPLLEHQGREDAFASLPASGGAGPSSGGGGFALPVNGKVTSPFGAKRGAETHSGMDIAAPTGSAVHPMAGGVVVDVAQDDRSGLYVRIKHDDGHVSSYAHLGARSVKAGDHVEAGTVIGTIGMTGHTTGPHVHLRVKDAAGNDVDPMALVGGKAGAQKVIGSTDAPRNWDLNAWVTGIRANGAKQGWTEGRIKAAEEQARSIASVDRAALEDQYRDASDKVAEWVGNYQAGHGGKNPAPDAIPSSLLSRMEPGRAASLRGDLARSQRAEFDASVGKAQNDAYLTAQLRMYDEPSAFMRADIGREYLGKVSGSQFASLKLDQARMRQQAGKPQSWDPYADSSKALGWYTSFNGLKLDDAQRATVLQTIKAQADELVKKKGAPPSDSEWFDFARRAARPVGMVGAFGRSEKPVYSVTAGDIDDARKERVRSAFKQTYRREPTDDELAAWYRKEQAGAPLK
ncbi:M23 family metallopeptidase [Novosphingobium sediminicola]|uniref:Murein DD-endopeptidase MepM/ murein hydrolase activator NlpD n=1 Tax=Novosphingobium sediminicola TaxID=563162 RepID=A0A7W6CI80_9SPHN|nr:M23 family metallopeptidase [Novosphingobium sediminicola]MBB3955935.1 murein DD-endopeptidase MepM/ murein hydrolase activator NlpD [Novosphingobium sediminicola]